MDANDLCGQLAEASRLRVYAAVVLGAGTSTEVATASGVDVRVVVKALQRLVGSGLVTKGEDGRLAAGPEVFKEAVRTAAPIVDTSPLDPDPERNSVLRAFVRDGRLTSIPAGHKKIRIVVEHIALRFEPGRRYAEKEIDAELKTWHADHAALRRYLIDQCVMTREDGWYWRSGGPVEGI